MLRRRRTRGEARDLLEAAYAASPAVDVLPEDVTPELSRVQGTDAAEIAVFDDRATGTTIVICAIDNLGKGAAGQAVQNANLALGYPETAGLRSRGVPGVSVTARHRDSSPPGCSAGIRRSAQDLAVVRSTAPAAGAAMFTAEPGPGRCRDRRPGHHLEAARAAGGRRQLGLGERGDRPARASSTRSRPRPRPARLLGL